MAEKTTKAKRKSTVPESETKGERFIRVITPRMNRALKAIKQVGRCTGSRYGYTIEQVKKIEDTLLDSVQDAVSRFEKGKGSQKESFTF